MKKVETLRAEFARTWPLILGRLLDIVSHGLGERPRAEVGKPSSMPDFDYWMTACETAEWPAGTFARAYAANKESLAAASLESDVVAGLIVEVLDAAVGWTGTAKELLDKISAKATEQQKRHKRWPRTSHAIGGRLRRASEVLRAKGWAVEFSRSSGKEHARIITIAPVPQADGTQTSETSERPKGNGSNGLRSDEVSDDASDDVRAADNGGKQHRPNVRTSSDGKLLISHSFGRSDVSDDVLPTPQGRRCAYCGKADPLPQACSWNGEAVMLHLDCEEYWVREHETD